MEEGKRKQTLVLDQHFQPPFQRDKLGMTNGTLNLILYLFILQECACSVFVCPILRWNDLSLFMYKVF